MYNREERSETFVIAPFLIGFFGFGFFQSCAAILAVEGFEVVTVTVATGTASLLQLLMFAHHRSRDNARRDGYDGVADEHNDGREEAAHGGNGRDVAIAKKKKMKIFGALIHSDRKSRLPSLMKVKSLKMRKMRMRRKARMTSR